MDNCKSCCGLFITNTNKPVPLTGIHYNVHVESFASRITIEQTYKNEENVDLECVYGFPINDQASVVSLTVKIDDRILTSQFKKKDEAFKEYNEALSKGNGAYLLDQSDRSDDTFILSVGRLPPLKECLVSISYISTLDLLTEKVLSLVIPMSLSPRFNPKQDVIPGQNVVNPSEKYQEKVPYLATLDAKITTFDTIQAVRSPSHPLAVKIEEPNKVHVSFGSAQQPVDRDIVIEIEVKTNPQHDVQVEHVKENQYAAMYSFIPHFAGDESERLSKIKTELIFLVDCSGSMQDENKIGDATRAMQIFLQSIPEGCYFNFYRFGSTFQSLFTQSEPYGSESFTKAKKYAKQTDANMGGTEILEPLRAIFSKAPRPGFSRQLFVLTDGDVTNTEQVIQLVNQNAHTTRVFSFGLGNSPSRSLVNGIAAAGNGKSEFIKQGQILEEKVGRHLKRALQPAVVNAEVSWEGVKVIQQVPTKLPPVFRGDRQLVFAFFEKEQKTGDYPSVVLKINGTATKTIFELSKSSTLQEDPILSKLTARAIIKELDVFGHAPVKGSQQNRAQKSEPAKELEEEITKISLSYGVLSKFVSLLAIEKRVDQSPAGNMELREIPIQKVGSSHAAVFIGNFRGAPPPPGGMGPQRLKCMSFAPMMGLRFAKRSFAATPSSSFNFQAETSDEMDAEDSEWSPEMNRSAIVGGKTNHIANKNSLLTQILDLQTWDGSWEFSEDLQRLIGISLDQLQQVDKHGLPAKALATLSVIAFLSHKYSSENDIWEALALKARVFLSKTVQQSVQNDVLQVVQTLLVK